eukprot:SAG11_NODE_3_length_39220_cov_67.005828_3_plen_187_part_00
MSWRAVPAPPLPARQRHLRGTSPEDKLRHFTHEMRRPFWCPNAALRFLVHRRDTRQQLLLWRDQLWPSECVVRRCRSEATRAGSFGWCGGQTSLAAALTVDGMPVQSSDRDCQSLTYTGDASPASMTAFAEPKTCRAALVRSFTPAEQDTIGPSAAQTEPFARRRICCWFAPTARFGACPHPCEQS